MTSRLSDPSRRQLFAAASRLLRYPDDELFADLPVLDEVVGALPERLVGAAPKGRAGRRSPKRRTRR